MGLFLNSIGIYDRYKTVTKGQYFVDKTALLEEIIPLLGQEQRFICITRPRRFGKTIMANMIGAFFEKGLENRKVFDFLEISQSEEYEEYIGKYNVIYIDFSETPEDCKDYNSYIKRISNGIKSDLQDTFTGIDLQGKISIWDMLSYVFEKTGEKFIFVMDEWDAPFNMEFVTESDRKSYLLFLKLLLKGKSYVELAYMTGILPIAKYSSGSELNMFLEYDMATKIKYSEYFGFSDEEVDALYDRYKKYTRKPRITREELRQWYDGYYTAARERIYNPRSIVCALSDNQLSNYWTSSGPYDEIFYYVKNDIKNIRNDLALMVIGERINAKIGDFAAVSMELKTKNQIYSAMVIYGLLTYDNGQVFIPNKELMLKYDELLQREDLFKETQLQSRGAKMTTILCYGDSNTYGYNPVNGLRYPKDIRWTGVLQKLLGEDYAVIEEGCNGRTTVFEDIAEPWKAGLGYLKPCLNTHKPIDFVIMMLGSNDLKRMFHASAKEIADGAEQLVSIIKEFTKEKQGFIPKVILVSPPEIGADIATSEFARSFDEDAIERSKELPAFYEEIAKKYDCISFNAAKVIEPSKVDSLHLMPEAHKKLAEELYKCIKENEKTFI